MNLLSAVSPKCVHCGYCCRKSACVFGAAALGGGCAFLTEDNLCGRYDEIKDHPGANISPAFGAGCCSPLFNTYRENKLKVLKEDQESFQDYPPDS